jgi:hypothetical protein
MSIQRNQHLFNPFVRMPDFCSMHARSAFAIFIVIGPLHREKPMRIRQVAVSAAFAAGLAAVPLATAKAQYYYPPCSPFPLSWPFCVAGAAVATAATIVTAPFVALAGPPYYYYGYYGRSRHHYARRHYAYYYYGPR